MSESVKSQPAVVDKDAIVVAQSHTDDRASITQEDVIAAQTAWGEGIVAISAVFIDGGDYVSEAQSLIDALYGYDQGPVLFKPTLAAKQPFRPSKTEALSYFIGGVVNEDHGFAIKPWEAVSIGPQQIILQGATAVAMGHYRFQPYQQGDEVLVEFTFGYFRDNVGDVRINVHHSSLPYSPES
ncbi:MAG: hypothetical protein AAF465_10655 [Pseudomonadota bacterium]